MSPVATRRRSRSQSDATDLSKASKGSAKKGRRPRRDRAESTGEVSLLSTASSVTKEKEPVGVDESKHDMGVVAMEDSAESPAEPEMPQKSEPTMDVVVHRIRCLNFHPKPVIAMKATETWCQHGLLALSRDNGSVELKSSDEKLRTIALIPGYRERPVTSLAWIRASQESITPILVGATRDGNVFVVNFAKHAFTGVTPSGGGGIFALESLTTISGCENLVAAGCEDGAVRVFEYHEKGKFSTVSIIPTSGAPILSLSYQSRYTNGKGLEGLTIFAAVADGTIRRFDCTQKNGKIAWTSVNRMTVESLGRNLPTRVWALKSLKDGTLVSANSLGQVQFWEGETGALIQSIEQTSTKADVLDLAVSADESRIFASGVDSRVVCIQRQLGAEDSAWILTQAQRPHTHDVKSLEICHKFIRNNSGKGSHEVELLVTGGLDTKLCTYNVAKYDKKRPRVLYPWPAVSPIFVAGGARIAGIAREDKVELYRLHANEEISSPLQVPEERMAFGTVRVRQSSNISCAAMSDDGKYLVIANMASCYIFSLTIDKKGRLLTKQLSFESKSKSAVSSIRFLDSDTLLLSTSDGSVTLVSLDQTDGNGKIRNPVQKTLNASVSMSLFPVRSMVTSSSGRYLATLRNSLDGGLVDVFSITVEKDIRHIWTIPSLESPVAGIAFVDDARIALTCIDFSLFVFDVKEQRLNKWNQDAGVSASLPPDLKYRKDFPVRILPHAGNSNKIIVSSFGMFVVFDLEKPYPTTCKCFPETHVRVRKRKRSMSTSESNAGQDKEHTTTICLRYNSMLHLGFVNEAEMVIVEQPWMNVVANFPPALARRVYGT